MVQGTLKSIKVKTLGKDLADRYENGALPPMMDEAVRAKIGDERADSKKPICPLGIEAPCECCRAAVKIYKASGWNYACPLQLVGQLAWSHIKAISDFGGKTYFGLEPVVSSRKQE